MAFTKFFGWRLPQMPKSFMYFLLQLAILGRGWSTGRRERSEGPWLQGKAGGEALTIVFSPVVTWTGTSSRWFRDSCPPTSTCSLCEYPGGLRTQTCLGGREGYRHLTLVAPPFLEFPTDPVVADSVFCFCLIFTPSLWEPPCIELLCHLVLMLQNCILPHHLPQPSRLIIIINAGQLCQDRGQGRCRGLWEISQSNLSPQTKYEIWELQISICN